MVVGVVIGVCDGVGVGVQVGVGAATPPLAHPGFPAIRCVAAHCRGLRRRDMCSDVGVEEVDLLARGLGASN